MGKARSCGRASLAFYFEPAPSGFTRCLAHIGSSVMLYPRRLCLLVVVVVGLVCFDDLWGYVDEPLMPDRSKVRFQTKRDTGVYAVRGWSRLASGTRLFIRRDCASEPVTA